MSKKRVSETLQFWGGPYCGERWTVLPSENMVDMTRDGRGVYWRVPYTFVSAGRLLGNPLARLIADVMLWREDPRYRFDPNVVLPEVPDDDPR